MFFKKNTTSKVERKGSDYSDTLKRMTAQTKRATVMAASANLSTLEGLDRMMKQATERRYY